MKLHSHYLIVINIDVNGSTNLGQMESAEIFNRLGSIHFGIDFEQVDEDSAATAKSMFLKAANINQSFQSWLGVGKACLVLKQFDEAEDALSVDNCYPC
jgi:hypothetical protein